MSAKVKLGGRVYYEVNTVRRQSCIKAVRCRRDDKIRYRSSNTVTGKPQYAEVVEVGPGAVVDGEKVPMEVKAGDKVIYSRYAGTEVKLGDDEYIIVKQADILAIVQ